MARKHWSIRQVWALPLIFLGVLGLLAQVAAAKPTSPRNYTEIRRLGLSKVGENTMLTLVLDRRTEAKVSSRTVSGKPQLVVEIPQARAGRVPTRLEGDDFLVDRVVTEAPASGGTVRIILDLFPDQPYVFWRQSRPGADGQTIFVVGLKADPSARPKLAQMRLPEPAPEAPTQDWKRQLGSEPDVLKRGELEPVEPEKQPEPAPEEYREEYRRPAAPANLAPGSFAELKHLIPKAGALLQGLEKEGWSVSESHNYDRPGMRFSRDFILKNHRYPELAVKILYLPANTPNTPNINIISLCTDDLSSESATKYRELRQWGFPQIKKHYEDIGDFFDEALKPLRVKLREETKAVALRDAPVFETFIKAACGDPKVAGQVMGLIQKKVSPRFEGLQYTVQESPLMLLNLVDFLYVKVYFIENR